jgi:hypothetical protein
MPIRCSAGGGGVGAGVADALGARVVVALAGTSLASLDGVAVASHATSAIARIIVGGSHLAMGDIIADRTMPWPVPGDGPRRQGSS